MRTNLVLGGLRQAGQLAMETGCLMVNGRGCIVHAPHRIQRRHYSVLNLPWLLIVGAR
jgi:hypothetical protein